MGSRSAQIGGSSILRASEGVLDKRGASLPPARGRARGRVLFDDGRVGIAGAPTAADVGELAEASLNRHTCPQAWTRACRSKATSISPPAAAIRSRARAVVDVDVETGRSACCATWRWTIAAGS